MTSETWKYLYNAQKWAELDQWWRFSEDQAALTEMFNWLIENIPKTEIQNGTESVRHPISSRDASPEWKYAASVLEQGELESTILGDPLQASVEWQEAQDNALMMLDQFIESREPTKGDKRLSRLRHAELAREALYSVDRNTKFLVNQIAITQNLARDQDWLRESFAQIAIDAFEAGIQYRSAAGKDIEADAIRGQKTLQGMRRGGEEKARQSRNDRKLIIDAMDEYLNRGSSMSKAAYLTFSTRKLGTSAAANLKRYNRHKNKNAE
jgi:hypothetical protein